MNAKHILFAAAAALSLAANAREGCYMHYQPGETSVISLHLDDGAKPLPATEEAR